MPKRTVCVQTAARISSAHRQLVVEADGDHVCIPFEDIWVVIMESRLCTVTTAALSDLSESGIGVIVCDSRHMPVGLQLPLAAHSRHAAIVEDQLLISKPLAKQLWKRIVEFKIANQARCMELMGIDGFEYLVECSRKVLSGDSSGREAVAAGYYFKKVLPKGTRREGPYAAVLDYGYAILRAGIARCAVSRGWLVSRGIHHASDLNPFNLVDDLIEPFRPMVDLVALGLGDIDGLDSRVKAAMACLFEYEVEIAGKCYTVQSAIEEELISLRDAVVRKDANLLRLPRTIPLSVRKVDER